MKVAVLAGGMSRERDVSLRTGKAVREAVAKLGHEAVAIDPDRDVARRLLDAAPDIVFIALHGRYGEDGTVQGLLELLGLPYTGSGVLASAAAIDKIFTKRIFQAAGLPTSPCVVFGVEEMESGLDDDGIRTRAAGVLPGVVKPAREGSSIGLCIVEEPSGIAAAVREALKHDRRVLVEKFIAGAELTVGIIGNRHPEPLPAIQIAPKSGRYDYSSKYTVGATEYLIPPRVDAAIVKRAQELALAAHVALGCSGVSRVDLIAGEQGVELLEVNTIPGMTETSLLPKAARAAGIEFHELIGRLIQWGLEPR